MVFRKIFQPGDQGIVGHRWREMKPLHFFTAKGEKRFRFGSLFDAFSNDINRKGITETNDRIDHRAVRGRAVQS